MSLSKLAFLLPTYIIYFVVELVTEMLDLTMLHLLAVIRRREMEELQQLCLLRRADKVGDHQRPWRRLVEVGVGEFRFRDPVHEGQVDRALVAKAHLPVNRLHCALQ
jgi:hypothetical protein